MRDATSTVTSKGQITIPKAVRDRLGLRQGDHVLFRVDDGGTVTMLPSRASRLGRVPGLLQHLAGPRPVTVEEMNTAIESRTRDAHLPSPR